MGSSADGVSQGMVDASTYQGKLYGLQPVTNTIGLFYNKDMLAEGRRPAAEDVGRAEGGGQEADRRRHVRASRSRAPANYEGTWQFLPFMWSNGGDETNIATPAGRARPLQLWVDLVNAGRCRSRR